MTANNIDEQWVALGCPNSCGMTDRPQKKSCNPESQTETQRCGQRTVKDCHRARRTSQEDRLGQRAMDRHDVSRNRLHQITAPPPNEKNDKKKLEAANAIDRPNTI